MVKKILKKAYYVDFIYDSICFERLDTAQAFYEKLSLMVRSHRFISFYREGKPERITFPTAGCLVSLSEEEIDSVIYNSLLEDLARVRINGL